MTRAQATKYKSDQSEKVRVPNVNEGFGPGLNKTLTDNQVHTFDGIRAKDATEDSNRGFDVIFQVDRGCFSRAGNAPDTQKIDGTFRFQVEVIHSRGGGVDDQKVVQAATSFQGYLETTQNYFFAQRMRFSKQENDKDVRLRITILDEELQSDTKFRVLAYGYDLV